MPRTGANLRMLSFRYNIIVTKDNNSFFKRSHGFFGHNLLLFSSLDLLPVCSRRTYNMNDNFLLVQNFSFSDTAILWV